MNKSWLTAITRKGPSIPARRLNRLDLLKGRMLDYGCGKGEDALAFGMEGYDPYHTCCYIIPWSKLPRRYYDPGTKPERGVKYDTITCSYVLNVVERNVRDRILRDIKRLLSRSGVAYITVRRDMVKNYTTRRGTKQFLVKLPLPVVAETKAYCIYKLAR